MKEWGGTSQRKCMHNPWTQTTVGWVGQREGEQGLGRGAPSRGGDGDIYISANNTNKK